jgi:hypothetical protein
MNELVNLKHLTPPAIKSHLTITKCFATIIEVNVYMDMETHFMNYYYLGRSLMVLIIYVVQESYDSNADSFN